MSVQKYVCMVHCNRLASQPVFHHSPDQNKALTENAKVLEIQTFDTPLYVASVACSLQMVLYLYLMLHTFTSQSCIRHFMEH